MKNILKESPVQSEYFSRNKRTVMYINQHDIQNKKVLDYGCGYGWFCFFLLKNNAKKVIGIDVNEDDLLFARDSINNKRASFLSLKEFSKLKISNKFDTITSWEVLEHIPPNSEKKYFKMMDSLLKTNGVLYLSTPKLSFFSFLDPAFFFGHRHYNISDIIDFMDGTELKVETVNIYGGWWTILGIINFYISKWIFRRKSLFGNFFQNKSTLEYMNDDKGFTNIFMKIRKSN